MAITIKLQYEGETRRFSSKNLTFKSLVRDVRSILNFNRDDGFKLSYRDEDGDVIRVTSDLELEEAIRVSGRNTIILHIVKDPKWVYSSDEDENETEPSASEKPANTEVLIESVAEAVNSISIDPSAPPVEERKEVTEIKQTDSSNSSTWQPIISTLRAKAGDMMSIDVSDMGLAQFCVTAGQRVETPRGCGTIKGTSLPDSPFIRLWIHLDGDRGISYWDDVIDYDTMICKGITPLAQQFAPVPTSDPVFMLPDAEAELKIDQAVRESIISEKQREISSYYESLVAQKK